MDLEIDAYSCQTFDGENQGLMTGHRWPSTTIKCGLLEAAIQPGSAAATQSSSTMVNLGKLAQIILMRISTGIWCSLMLMVFMNVLLIKKNMIKLKFFKHGKDRFI
jgi:hypothetical protein